MGISVLVVRTTFAYTLRSVMGVEALWWSFAAGSVSSLVLAVAYYRFGNWRGMHMRKEQPVAGLAPDTGLGMPRQRANLAPETPDG